jgi:hypothetical protein
LCLATARWSWALGAFLLFVANSLSIEMATALVFGLAGLAEPAPSGSTAAHFVRRFGLSLLLLVLIAGYMTHALAALVTRQQLSRGVEAVLTQETSARVGARLSNFRLEQAEGGERVVATVLTPKVFEPDQVSAIQQALQERVNPQLYLVIRSLLSQDMDSKGPVFIPDEERQQRAQAKEETEFLARVSQALNAYMSKLNGAEVSDVQREPGTVTTVSAVVRTPATITPAQVAQAQAQLQQALGIPVRLTITSMLARSADATEYLGGPEQPPLTGEALRLYQRLEEAVQNQAGLQVPGAQLTELQEEQKNGRMLVRAFVRTPRAFEPAQVQAMQAALRQSVAPNLDLIVRSVVGGEASATGYLPVEGGSE